MSVRGGLRAGTALLVPAVLALACCTPSERPGSPASGEQPGPPGSGAPGCGPPAAVAGDRPAYVDRPLERFSNDRAACQAAWLPETGHAFVPQGLVVRDDRAWVSGYDGDGPEGTKYCRVLRVDLRPPRLVDQVGELQGEVGSRGVVPCRHAGGLALDRHGLWLSETTRLWLLDPETLDVRRVWSLRPPVQGGFLVLDDAGRLGVGDYRDHGRPRMWWYSLTNLLDSELLDVTEEAAADWQRVPTSSQGAVHGDLGPGGVRTWFVAPTRAAADWSAPALAPAPPRGLVPGAEGASLDEGRMWVVSESASEVYSGYGDRPVLPHLVQLDVGDVGSWTRAECSPSD